MRICYTQVEDRPTSDDDFGEKADIQKYLERFASPGTEVTYIITAQEWTLKSDSPPSGAFIYLSATPLLRTCIQAEADGFDAIILGGT